MQYFALLISQERDLTPDERAAGMTAYQNFHAKVASAIRGGDALLPTATGVRITGGPDAPVVTDGPFAEAAEVACGYYVFEADNLDEALALAGGVPAAQNGAVEVWPTYHVFDPDWSRAGGQWLALLLEPPGSTNTPGTPEWQAEAARHGEFAAAAGFSQPILHGLCTYGMTCKAIVDALLDGDAGAVAAYGARFSGVAFPGETLKVGIWKDDGRFLASVVAPSRDNAVVLSGVELVPT